MKKTFMAMALVLASTSAMADSFYKYDKVDSKAMSTETSMELRGSVGTTDVANEDTLDVDLGFKFVDNNNIIYKIDADYKEIDESNLDAEMTNLSAALGYNYEVGQSDIGVYAGLYAFDSEAGGMENDVEDYFVGVSADVPILDDDVSLDLYVEHYNNYDDTEIFDTMRYGADVNFKVTSNLDAFVGVESFGHAETMKAGVALKF